MNRVIINESQFDPILEILNNASYFACGLLIVTIGVLLCTIFIINKLERSERLKLMPFFVPVEGDELKAVIEIPEQTYFVKLANSIAFNTHFSTVSPPPFFIEELDEVKYNIISVGTVIKLRHNGAFGIDTLSIMRKHDHPVLLIYFEDYFNRKYYQQIFLDNSSLKISKPIPEKRW